MASTSKGNCSTRSRRGRRRRLRPHRSATGVIAKCERFLRIEDERGTVAVTVGGSVARLHRTDFAWMGEYDPVGVIDRNRSMMTILDRSGSRSSSLSRREVVGDIFESVSIDSTEPIHDRFVVVRRLVSVFRRRGEQRWCRWQLVRRFSNRRRRGRALDAFHR